MAPKHENPKLPERTATAPYNFVSVPERVVSFPDRPGTAARVDQSVYHADSRYTGWIDVELTTLSPLYIRGGLSPQQYEAMERQEKNPADKTPHLKKLRNRPEFFHTGDPDAPVIPGSSLRGMLRTMCEIIGHGKLSPVSDQALVYRAVGDTSSHGEAYRKELMNELPGRKNWFEPRFEAGYIREDHGRWYIQQAERLNSADSTSPTYARINNRLIPAKGLEAWGTGRQTYELYVQCDDFEFKKVRGGFVHIKRANVKKASTTPGPDLRRAVLAMTGPVPKKASEAVVFAPDATKQKDDWIRIPDGTDPADRRDLVKEYLDQVTKTGKHNQKELLGSDQGALQDGHPVMYVMEGDKLLRFFGHTQMFRMPYRFSPRELLPGEHNDEGRLDLAQLMFGTVRSRGGGAAGRVFVEDGRLLPKQGNVWLPEKPVLMPKILSGPKPTTFQHNVTQPQPDVARGRGLKTYNDRGQTTLRGHKLYWHKDKDLKRDAFEERALTEEQAKESQHTLMKPVRAGVSFQFRVRFENLLAEELGLLWWAVRLPAPGEYAHKLGMGKPLGLGSVRLTPRLTLIDPQARYGAFVDAAGTTLTPGLEPPAEHANVEAGAVREFEKLVARALKLPEGTRLADTPRMRQLLEMLRWPGPPPAKTRYMNIGIDEETNKITGTNEFKDRKVLPDPVGVARGR